MQFTVLAEHRDVAGAVHARAARPAYGSGTKLAAVRSGRPTYRRARADVQLARAAGRAGSPRPARTATRCRSAGRSARTARAWASPGAQCHTLTSIAASVGPYRLASRTPGSSRWKRSACSASSASPPRRSPPRSARTGWRAARPAAAGGSARPARRAAPRHCRRPARDPGSCPGCNARLHRSRASRSRLTSARCVLATPFGAPVEPDV